MCEFKRLNSKSTEQNLLRQRKACAVLDLHEDLVEPALAQNRKRDTAKCIVNQTTALAIRRRGCFEYVSALGTMFDEATFEVLILLR